MKLGRALAAQQMNDHHVLQRAGHKEVLLFQAEHLARNQLVVGVEDLGDRFALHLGVDGSVVVTVVKALEVERLHGFRFPQTQQVGAAAPIAKHRRVIRDAFHHPGRDPPLAHVARRAGGPFRRPSETNLARQLRPGISQGFPNRSHSSVISTCQPSTIFWSKIPNS